VENQVWNVSHFIIVSGENLAERTSYRKPYIVRLFGTNEIGARIDPRAC